MKRKIEKHISRSVSETHSWAKKVLDFINLNKEHYTKKGKQAAIILLDGILGSGKTEFTKGFAKSLGIKDNVLSPTFLIMKKYDNLYHLDCYRLLPKPDKALEELDLFEIINDSNNIVVFEWGDKLKLLKKYVKIKIHFDICKNSRKIQISY